jgi:anti-anti-sigma regulatory factor
MPRSYPDGMWAPTSVNNSSDSCVLWINSEAGIDIFFLAGIIDARAQKLLDELHFSVKAPRVRFDFGEVKRINSMGIALLLRCFKQIRDQKHAQIWLSNVNEVNFMLFRITGIFLLAEPEVKMTENGQQ